MVISRKTSFSLGLEIIPFFPFRYAAKDKRTLRALHITHVLNAADGKFNVNTGPAFYRDTQITYHGVEAFDMPSFNLRPFFYPAANFIKTALSSSTGEEPLRGSQLFLQGAESESFVSQVRLGKPLVVSVIKT